MERRHSPLFATALGSLVIALGACSDDASAPGDDTAGASATESVPLEPSPPALTPEQAMQNAEKTIDASNLDAEIDKLAKEIEEDEKGSGGGN